MSNYEMKDDAFLSYVQIHSLTERALFSRKQIKRLYRLAGMPLSGVVPAWVSLDAECAGPFLIRARRRLAGRNDDA